MSEPIRVVIAAPTMARGGTERQLVYLAAELPRNDVEVRFVLLASGGPLEAELRATGAHVVAPEHIERRPLRTWTQAQRIAREIKTWRPQIVHSFLSEPHFAAALGVAMASKERPLLVHSRRSTNFYAASRPLAAALERRLHRSCVALIGNSTAVARELAQESAAPDKVAVIHNGAPIAALDAARSSREEARQRLELAIDALVLAVVANLYSYKRHRDVLAALATIKGELPADWVLLLAGRDAGERARLEAQSRVAGLAAHVRFLGEVRDVAPVHAAADLELLVSEQEGFSNALLEAMAAGVPAVVSDSGGNPDAVVNDETGLICPTGDVDALAAAILRLARNPALRRRYGAAARARVEQNFTMEACAAQHARLWRGLMDNPGQPVAAWFGGARF